MSIFSQVAFRTPKESRFNMSHDVKLSFNMGKLIPVLCEETLPGDRWRLTTQSLLRMAPMLAPVMHKVDVYVHHFFVANRIVFPEFNDFMYQTKPGYTPPVRPFFGISSVPVGSLADHLGLPTSLDSNETVNALPFAAYQKIWNDYFRDENLEPELDCTLTEGNNTARYAGTFGVLRNRAWQKDYFTSALPWAQKGDAITMPTGTLSDVPVIYNGNTEQQPEVVMPGTSGASGTDWPLYASPMDGGTPSKGEFKARDGSAGAFYDAHYDPKDTLTALTSELTLESATIEELRVSMLMQEWLEKSARGGTRSNEGGLVHFGVRSSDGRLQRPDYLGGSINPMVISEVLQTSESVETPQGNMAGHGLSAVNGRFIDYFCEEHGWMISVISILPKTAYQQGIHRKWSREDRFDYAWPTFANLGEQAVLNKEIYYDNGMDPNNNGVFGYQSRYAEYKHVQSRVSGEFQESLAFWHMGRIFDAPPALNGTFVAADPTHRIFAVTDPAEDKIYAHVFHNASVTRKLPKYGIPVSLG